MGHRRVELRAIREYIGTFAALLFAPLVQLATFIYLARLLSIEEYGDYLLLIAWVPILIEFVGLGTGEALIRAGAVGNSGIRARFIKTIMITGITSLPVALILTILGAIGDGGLNEKHLALLIVFYLSEVLGGRLSINCEHYYLAAGKAKASNLQKVALPIGRLLLLIVLLQVYRGLINPLNVALVMAIGSLIVGVASTIVAIHFSLIDQCNEDVNHREAVWFALNQVLRASQQNIDRVVLSSTLIPVDLATYGVAQRFYQFGLVPLQALLRTQYQKFFRAGYLGKKELLVLGRKNLGRAVYISILTAICLVIGAPIVTAMIGHKYESAIGILIQIAPALVLAAVTSVGADVLSGFGWQSVRVGILSVGVVTQALLYSLAKNIDQAIVALYFSQISISIGIWLAILLLKRVRSDNEQPK